MGKKERSRLSKVVQIRNKKGSKEKAGMRYDRNRIRGKGRGSSGIGGWREGGGEGWLGKQKRGQGLRYSPPIGLFCFQTEKDVLSRFAI
jgi:hypothetical protein